MMVAKMKTLSSSIAIFMGINPTIISKHKFGDKDLGF